jgi:hypothetical protein
MLVINFQSAWHHIPDDHNLCLVCTLTKCKVELANTRLKSHVLKLIEIQNVVCYSDADIYVGDLIGVATFQKF